MSGGEVSVLLSHHLKALRLPVFLREYQKVAAQCAREKSDMARFLLALSELELIERDKRGAERRVREAGFPVIKTLDGFDFTAIPGLNKRLVMELARGEYLSKRENVLAVGNSGTGKTHLAIALGLCACHEGLKVKFFTAAGLVTALTEARDEKVLLRFKKQLARKDLVIVDEFGYVPFSKTGAELLFEFFAERYERGSVMITTNLSFDQWTEVLGSERLTGALLDRLTHRVHILEMNGESYRFRESVRRLGKKTASPKLPDREKTKTNEIKTEEKKVGEK
jgi:DNA replication protein DnaC